MLHVSPLHRLPDIKFRNIPKPKPAIQQVSACKLAIVHVCVCACVHASVGSGVCVFVCACMCG